MKKFFFPLLCIPFCDRLIIHKYKYLNKEKKRKNSTSQQNKNKNIGLREDKHFNK